MRGCAPAGPGACPIARGGRRGHRGSPQHTVVGDHHGHADHRAPPPAAAIQRHEGLRDDLVAAHPAQARYLRDRWYFHLTASQRAASCARTWVYASRFVSVAGLAVLPAIVTLQGTRPGSLGLQVLATVTSVVVALSGGVLSIARVHERWRLGRGLQEKLGRAGWDLLHRPGSFAVFHERVERDLAAAELVYRSSVAAVTEPAAAADDVRSRGQAGRELSPIAA